MHSFLVTDMEQGNEMNNSKSVYSDTKFLSKCMVRIDRVWDYTVPIVNCNYCIIFKLLITLKNNNDSYVSETLQI